MNVNDMVATATEQQDTPSMRAIRRDTDAYDFMLSMFNGSVAMMSGKGVDVALGSAGKVLATTDLLASSSGQQNLELGSKTVQMLLTSASLISLGAKANPWIAVSTIGAATATKMSIAFGLANDNQQAKCLAAITDLAAGGFSGVVGGLMISTGGGAVVGSLIVVSAIAQVILAGRKAHLACSGQSQT